MPGRHTTSTTSRIRRIVRLDGILVIFFSPFFYTLRIAVLIRIYFAINTDKLLSVRFVLLLQAGYNFNTRYNENRVSSVGVQVCTGRGGNVLMEGDGREK